MELFTWIENKKLDGEDPFWALVDLVRQDNSTETMQAVMSRVVEADTEGAVFDAEEEAALQREAEAEEELEEDSDEDDLEKFH